MRKGRKPRHRVRSKGRKPGKEWVAKVRSQKQGQELRQEAMNRMNSEGRKPGPETGEKAESQEQRQEPTGPRTEAKARSPEGWKRTECEQLEKGKRAE
jgi:hypothetical protein